MAKSKTGNGVMRVFITLLGVAFILWGITTVVLGFAGEKATAVITDIRREGGERNDVIAGRYTYNISYTFSLPNGKKVDGFSKKIGNSVYVKADGKSTTAVRYFASFPFINALEKDTGPGLGQLILAAAGLFLILVMNKRRKGFKKKRNKI